MEVQRSEPPQKGFGKNKTLCTQKGIILIFDECTSGLGSLGGYIKYNVHPDMAMFGKALGNGYAITAIAGIEVMEAAQKTFISSTLDRKNRPFCGTKTLEIMETIKSWDQITKNGIYLRFSCKNWQTCMGCKLNILAYHL